MAFTGLAKITVAKLDESKGTPAYTEGFRCGKAIELTIDRKYAEGSLDGDNVQAEYDKEFRYADVNMNTTTLPIKAHSVMFGHSVTAVSYTHLDVYKRQQQDWSSMCSALKGKWWRPP